MRLRLGTPRPDDDCRFGHWVAACGPEQSLQACRKRQRVKRHLLLLKFLQISCCGAFGRAAKPGWLAPSWSCEAPWVGVMRAACCGVVLGEAMGALQLPLCPACEGLAVKPLVGHRPVQVFGCQLLPAVQAVVCDPVCPLVYMGRMNNRRLIGPQLGRFFRESCR